MDRGRFAARRARTCFGIRGEAHVNGFVFGSVGKFMGHLLPEGILPCMHMTYRFHGIFQQTLIRGI